MNNHTTSNSSVLREATIFISNTVRILSKDFSCNENIKGKYKVDEGTSMVGDLSFQIYPNPAKDQITIISNQVENIEVFIRDITGQIKKIIKINKKEVIDLQTLDVGIYFISFIGEDGSVSSQKLVIQS